MKEHVRFSREKIHLERFHKYGGEIRNIKRALHFICHVRPDFVFENLTLAQLVTKVSTFKETGVLLLRLKGFKILTMTYCNWH